MSTSAFIKCDCNNNCYPVDPCSTSTICKPASEVCYSGPALFCSGILPNDNLNVALQKIDSKLCGEALVINVFDEIINNPTLYQQFVDLVNGAIDCEVVNNCFTTTTTTTTPYVPVSCTDCGVQGIVPEGGTWEALDCIGRPVSGSMTQGQTILTGCIDESTLVLVGANPKGSTPC